MDGVNNSASEVLDVLEAKIQCDVCWNGHILRCLSFLRRCKKHFSSSDLHAIYTTYIRKKTEYNSYIKTEVYFETLRPHTTDFIYTYLVDWRVDCNLHYKQNSLFSRNVRMCKGYNFLFLKR